MEIVALLITISVLALTFLLGNVEKEREARVFMAIQLAKNGVRFPCRFLKEFYGYTLSENERVCVKEITACEGECSTCF